MRSKLKSAAHAKSASIISATPRRPIDQNCAISSSDTAATAPLAKPPSERPQMSTSASKARDESAEGSRSANGESGASRATLTAAQ